MDRPDRRPVVAITGAAGKLGTVVGEGLQTDYEVRGIDIRAPRRARPRWFRADARKLDRIRPALAGADAVVHLAVAATFVDPSWRDVLERNVLATLTVLEAARLERVRRVVLASSNHVTGLYEQDAPYADIIAGRYGDLDPEAIPRLAAIAPVRPDSPYGAGKVFEEVAARYTAEEGDLTVICLRIGTVLPANRPTRSRHFATFLSHRDLVHLVDVSLRASDIPPFSVFYGVSANRWRIWDIDDARDLLGYRPSDDAEAWR